MSLKNPVIPPGIDPGTVRLVAQRLNHYATPGSEKLMYTRLFALHKKYSNKLKMDSEREKMNCNNDS